MSDIIILITTRDYPFKDRSGWQSVNMCNVNNHVRDHVNLNDSSVVRPMESYLEDEPELIKDDAYAEVIKRILVWNDKDASYCQDLDYFEVVKNDGFFLKKKDIDNGDKVYHIYVAPCVAKGDHLDLSFRKLYSLSVLLDVFADCGDVTGSEVILVAHDKDVSSIAGFGVVNDSLFYLNGAGDNKPRTLTVCKFQHEAGTDTIYKTIVEPVKNNNISAANCDSLVEYIGKSKSPVLYETFSKDLVTRSYLGKINIEKLLIEPPELETQISTIHEK